VKSVDDPDVTYVSLNEDNPERKRYLPWTGTNHGPKPSSALFEGIGGRGRPRLSEVREVLVQDDKVAMFARSRIAAASPAEITSPSRSSRN